LHGKVAFSEVVIIVRRLIREGWRRYRWEKIVLPDISGLSAEPLRLESIF
jgi:hypothetical protein